MEETEVLDAQGAAQRPTILCKLPAVVLRRIYDGPLFFNRSRPFNLNSRISLARSSDFDRNGQEGWNIYCGALCDHGWCGKDASQPQDVISEKREKRCGGRVCYSVDSSEYYPRALVVFKEMASWMMNALSPKQRCWASTYSTKPKPGRVAWDAWWVTVPQAPIYPRLLTATPSETP